MTAEEWFNSAYNKGESGDYQGAIADYNQAIKIKPDYALAYNNRGNAKYNLGDKQGAIADYNQAIQIKPDYAYQQPPRLTSLGAGPAVGGNCAGY